MKFFSFSLALLLLSLFRDVAGYAKNDTGKIPDDILIDSLVVWKSERIMTVYSRSKEIKSYNIALGKNPVGKKQFEGDYKTPEGLYRINAKSPYSKFHKNLNISYPDQNDVTFAEKYGKPPGGEIKIHGLPNTYHEKNYSPADWTWGCIALTNTEIDELYDHIKMGSPILILP